MHNSTKMNLCCDKDKTSKKKNLMESESSRMIALHCYSELEQAGSRTPVLSQKL